HYLPVDLHLRAHHPTGDDTSSISFSTHRVCTWSPESRFHRGEMLPPNTRSPHLMTRVHRAFAYRAGQSAEVQRSIGMHVQQTSSEVHTCHQPHPGNIRGSSVDTVLRQ